MSTSDKENLDYKFKRDTEILTGAKPGTKMPEELVGIIKIATGDDNVDFLKAISMVKTPLKIVRIMPPRRK